MPAIAWLTGASTARLVACRSSADGSSTGGAPPPLPPPAAAAPAAAASGSAPIEDRSSSAQPWQLAAYYTKKLERRTDSLGNILSSPNTIAEAPGWTPDAQLRLAAEALAPQLQQDASTLLDQVERLQQLLPSMGGTLGRIKPAQLVRMAAQLEQIAAQLVALRSRFPTADVAAMVAGHPQLLRMLPEEVDAAVAAIACEFPEAAQEEVEAMLSCNPALLDGSSLAACLEGVGHLLTRRQIAAKLARDPTFLYQFQPLEGQSRGERDAEYLADKIQSA